MRSRLIPLVLAAVLSGVAPIAAGAAGAAHRAHGAARAGGAVFSFGRVGGNIRPFTVTIYADGSITSSGAVTTSPQAHLSPDAIKGLKKLARAEHFDSLPDQIPGSNVNPDIASLFITVTTAQGTKTVKMHGGQSRQFQQLFAVLQAVAGAY